MSSAPKIKKSITNHAPAPGQGSISSVAEIVEMRLRQQTRAIDKDGLYPAEVLRDLGAAGSYRSHVALDSKAINFQKAIEDIATVAEECVSTAFCMWCQSALGWYVYASDNELLKKKVLSQIADGNVLGGTGLSNPLKHLCGIEKIRLTATPSSEGYRVSGILPWVSNLGEGHLFAAVFQCQDGRYGMGVFDCSNPAIKMNPAPKMVGLDGTGTYSVKFDNYVLYKDAVLTVDFAHFLPKIRPGFILLQMGMGIGLLRSVTSLLDQEYDKVISNSQMPEFNPQIFKTELAEIEAEVASLSGSPFDSSDEFLKRVLRVRARASEVCMRAAEAITLVVGARSYVAFSTADRKRREAYFVAIVTPALKQLRLMLQNMK